MALCTLNTCNICLSKRNKTKILKLLSMRYQFMLFKPAHSSSSTALSILESVLVLIMDSMLEKMLKKSSVSILRLFMVF